MHTACLLCCDLCGAFWPLVVAVGFDWRFLVTRFGLSSFVCLLPSLSLCAGIGWVFRKILEATLDLVCLLLFLMSLLGFWRIPYLLQNLMEVRSLLSLCLYSVTCLPLSFLSPFCLCVLPFSCSLDVQLESREEFRLFAFYAVIACFIDIIVLPLV